MVKTTINLEDELYKKLVKEAVEKYGKARSFSKLINEKLRETKASAPSKIRSKKEKMNIIERSFGIWKMKESGKEYVRKIRDESEKRLKRLGL